MSELLKIMSAPKLSSGQITNDAGTKLELPWSLGFLFRHPFVQVDLERGIRSTDMPVTPTALEVHNRTIRNRFSAMVIGFVHRRDIFSEEKSTIVKDGASNEKSAKEEETATFETDNMYPIIADLVRFDVQPLRILFRSPRTDLVMTNTPFSGKGAFWLFGKPPSFTRRHLLMLLGLEMGANKVGAGPYKLVTSREQLDPVGPLDTDFDPEHASNHLIRELGKAVATYEKYVEKDEACRKNLRPIQGIDNPTPDIDEVLIELSKCEDYDDAALMYNSALGAMQTSKMALEVRRTLNLAGGVYNRTVAMLKARRATVEGDSSEEEDSDTAAFSDDDETF